MDKRTNSHFLTLIIPVYKQEKTIVENLKQIKKILDQIRYHHEIIVVVDGIVDKSIEKIKQAMLPGVVTVGYIKNQGKSYAIRMGMKKAKGDYVMFIDAGMEIDPNGISMLLEHMEWYNADIIVGSKRHPASQVNYPLNRKILSYGYYYLVKFLFGLNVRDTQAGIKIFKKDVLQKVLPRLLEKKFAGDLEFLVVAQILGFRRIYEAPIKLDYSLSPITTAAGIRAIWGILVDTLAIFYRKNIIRYYQR
ncbi:UDP-glucose:dolichyl-phosphate glucosyltransferase [Candidatus Roizmanbacteria bacterium CG02_land_8_20_14_3_00_36_15]|nr:MAG: UDP-glucose:dolichyl-phosphate glucosyltransferase [Candidatus Roizmanbacteria bacterium CG03_land_8_20_14_0_80_36_21]PIV37803.1 MAG: UDP-glucose:dolichyl-phosphate glucosyltransferase [Candidatus Roizmanbacteria bacterium CG02_land_8_20_14_3_00_36_15]PJA52600.1 MAG: UDP-glucose:dolichyl-phosphate glucosyltransferase [Candidatus Roizmanbacteria bacterium CG_4_9_14_3_um_filter_36_11]